MSILIRFITQGQDVDHELILLKVVFFYLAGILFIRPPSVCRGKSQYVETVNKTLQSKTLSTSSIGVPQGGKLSPLLFFIFSNDFHM